MTTKKFVADKTLALLSKRSVFFSSLFCLLFTPISVSAANDLRLAVASNFMAPIKQLATEFEQKTGYIIQLSFGSSGKLFAQIQNNAPFDIFLSADVAKPEALIKNQQAQQDSLIIYAKGQLALWSVHPINAITLKDAVLKAKRIAIANPKLAPYGKAAEESMRNLSTWDQVNSKIVMGENIGQTYQFVYSQNTEIGFVAYSQVLAGQVKGSTMKVPNNLYNDINQAGVILSQSKNTELAKAFMTFLTSHDIQAKIAAFGYASKSN
jgi:molybdate transport system substrate-binding protein